MDENRVDEFLEHHGIKGQRWGIRRTPEQLGHKVDRLKKKTAKLEQKIYDNEQLMKVYQNTIKAINSGQIKKGESWVENFLMMYKGSLDDED